MQLHTSLYVNILHRTGCMQLIVLQTITPIACFAMPITISILHTSKFDLHQETSMHDMSYSSVFLVGPKHMEPTYGV